MKVGFLLAFEESPHAGTARPMITWASKSDDSAVLLYNCSENLEDAILSKVASESMPTSVFTFEETYKLFDEIKSSGMEFLVGSDRLQKLELLDKIKSRTEVKTVTFIQEPHAINAIGMSFHGGYLSFIDKIKQLFISSIPFRFVAKRYVKLLNRQDLTVANSTLNSSLMRSVYNVDIDGIVYPPVNTEVFCPKPAESDEEEKGVLVHLGVGLGGDTDEFLAKKSCKLASEYSHPHLLGNEKLADEIAEEIPRARKVKDIGDEELSKIYSECEISVCPQVFELFGYVPVESMACGTPPLALDHTGARETIIHGETGWISSKRNFLRILEGVLSGKLKIRKWCIREHAKRFSAENSVKDLDNLLKSYKVRC